MRKKGENSFKCAGKSAIPPDNNNNSPLVSKVNSPSHLADSAAHRDCSAVEAASCCPIEGAFFLAIALRIAGHSCERRNGCSQELSSEVDIVGSC